MKTKVEFFKTTLNQGFTEPIFFVMPAYNSKGKFKSAIMVLTQYKITKTNKISLLKY